MKLQLKRKICLFLSMVFLISIFINGTSITYAGNNSKNLQEIDPKERQIIVKYADATKAEAVKSKVKQKKSLSKLDLKKKSKDNKMEVLEASDNADIDSTIAELKKDKDVVYAQKNNKINVSTAPSDPMFDQQWALSNSGQTIAGVTGTAGIDIKAVEAWGITEGSPSIVVGVLDTGIDISHPDLAGNIFVNSNEIANNGIDDDGNGYIDDINGYDFINVSNNVYNANTSDYHGTHIAGIIAASANSIGIRGVAPNVKILPLKFMNNNVGYTSDAIEAIEYSQNMGIKIINCS